MSDSISPFYQIKSIFLGSSNAGKSSLINLLHSSHHDTTIATTIGIDFLSLTTELEEFPLTEELPSYFYELKGDPKAKSVQTIKSHIWDAAGTGKYFSIVKSYLRDVDIAFLVFDLSDRESWNALEIWKKELEKEAKYENYPLLVLVGNKSDQKRQITEEEIIRRSNEWNAKFYISSCIYKSSSSMVKKMYRDSVLNYHQLAYSKQLLEEEIPKHIKVSFYRKTYPGFIELGVASRPNYCCHQ